MGQTRSVEVYVRTQRTLGMHGHPYNAADPVFGIILQTGDALQLGDLFADKAGWLACYGGTGDVGPFRKPGDAIPPQEDRWWVRPFHEVGNPATRSDVYRAIDSEREYQDRNWPDKNGAGSNRMSVGEFVLLAMEYVTRAMHEWSKEKKPNGITLHFVRKVAAICVNCMEQHGAPHREG